MIRVFFRKNEERPEESYYYEYEINEYSIGEAGKEIMKGFLVVYITYDSNTELLESETIMNFEKEEDAELYVDLMANAHSNELISEKEYLEAFDVVLDGEMYGEEKERFVYKKADGTYYEMEIKAPVSVGERYSVYRYFYNEDGLMLKAEDIGRVQSAESVVHGVAYLIKKHGGERVYSLPEDIRSKKVAMIPEVIEFNSIYDL